MKGMTGVNLGQITDVIYKAVDNVNSAVNDVVWGMPMIILILATGVIMTFGTKFFQVTRARHVTRETIGGMFRKKDVRKSKDKNSISQFQALCTALAATIGTGNIAGVATAIVTGGPGAVFWMWLSAFFGMMTNYSENVLGIYYRRRNEKGEWSGGAMYYLRDGLGSKKNCKTLGRVLAVFFSIFCIMASFGIGNMSQINTIASTMDSTFATFGIVSGTIFGGVKVIPLICGIVLMIVAALVIIGGIKRIASVTEKLVPFMAVGYIIGTLIIVFMNFTQIPAVFAAIFKGAFGFDAIAGGILGELVKKTVTMGFKRGIFSNEAGLGSSVMVHSASNVKEPVMQGIWGIFEVFADTIVVCTLTAFTILSSGAVDLSTGLMLTSDDGATLVSDAFTKIHPYAGAFISIALLLFAFSTVLGWSFYGTKSVEYLFGRKGTIVYKVIFVLFIVIGATMHLDLAWALSDTFNALMAIPNLIGVLTLSGTVFAITRNYVSRIFNGRKEKPMLSAFDDIQKEQEAALKAEE